MKVKIAAKIINFDNDSNPPMSAIHEGNIFIMFNSNKVALFEGSLLSNWINVISSLSLSLFIFQKELFRYQCKLTQLLSNLSEAS